MTKAEAKRKSLWDRWSRLEQIKRRTPSQAEFASAVIEQTGIEDELQSLAPHTRSGLQ